MTDEPDRRKALVARLLAMKGVPGTADAGPAVPLRALRLPPAQINAVRTALAGEVGDWLEDRSLVTRALDSMTAEERDAVQEAACNALMNAAPIVRSYTARQHGEAYPVWIAGIEDVYLLMAPGHDALGPFGTLSEAVDAMERAFGAVLVGD